MCDANAGGVFAAQYRFDKHRVIVERDGSESYVPFSETLYLLKLPGTDRKLWLRPWERLRVLEALQEVDPLRERQRALAPSGGESRGEAR